MRRRWAYIATPPCQPASRLLRQRTRRRCQRGAFLSFRTGSGVVNVAAARLLDIPTTA